MLLIKNTFEYFLRLNKNRIFARNKIKAFSLMSSFIADKVVMDGLTYDDVLLIPAYSEVLPKTVAVPTRVNKQEI